MWYLIVSFPGLCHLSYFDTIEVTTKYSLKESVSELKSEIIDGIKDDINSLVDSRNKGLGIKEGES